MLAIRVGVAALLLTASVSAALATCQGRVVLFEDRFERLQPTWGEADQSFQIENGKLVVESEPAAYLWRTNQASRYDDVDMCVALTTIEAVEPESGARRWLDTGSARVRQAYAASAARVVDERTRRLRKAGVDVVDVDTLADYVEPLRRFFERRERRRLRRRRTR